MRILVTGANGQLGNEMRIIARECAHDFIFTDVNQVEGQETMYLDITDLDAIREMVARHRVQTIVNCAAWTNVDACETDPQLAALAEKLNADAPENLALAMREVGGWLVHISTDYVFGKEPYNVPCQPDQTGTPTGVYGTTKLHGEQRIKQVFGSAPTENRKGGYIIIRTAWLYSEFGKNFCKTMLQLTASKPALKVVFDQVGTPTYALDLALAIRKIVDTVEAAENPASYAGVYHFSNEGVCSWYDFTKMIQEYSGQTLCNVQPCHSSEFPSPVTRPAYSVLDKTAIKSTFDVEVPYWTDSLKRCLANLLK